MAIIYSHLSPFSMSTGRVNFRLPLGLFCRQMMQFGVWSAAKGHNIYLRTG